MAADDPCGPAIDFDNTGCLRISGTSLFVSGSPFRPGFLPVLLPSSPVSAPFFLLSGPVFLLSATLAFRFRPLPSASGLLPVSRCCDPSLQSSSGTPHGCISASCKNAKGDPQGAAFGRKGRSAAAYSSAASGRITTFTRLLSSRIFWASFCTSAFETVRMACSPLAT